MPALRLDPERMLQVLRNLMGNAVKFTPTGGQVSIAVKRRDGILEVSVKDSGPGIPAESLNRSSKSLVKVAHAGANHRQGTGLGLAIAKNIISSHGGNIWAESQSGSGSRFDFCFALLLFVSGCGLFPESNRRRELREALTRAKAVARARRLRRFA